LKITVITAEYNPLHNGHSYHIQKTREAFPDNFLLVVMSGSFVMRGEPAVLDKFTRATHAIQAGADAVVELPAFSSFLSGEKFAESAVKIAKAVKADVISFGSESGNLSAFYEINDIIKNPSDEFDLEFRKNLKNGKSYPRSLCETFSALYPEKRYTDVLSKPNDTLGLFYVRAMENSDIKPFTVKRIDGGYDSEKPVDNFLSASGIRELIKSQKLSQTHDFLPDYVYRDLASNHLDYVTFSTLCLFKLRTMGRDKIAELYDVNEGLENRFEKYLKEVKSLDQLLEKVKTKRYTLSRLRRIVLYALFDVTKEKAHALLSSPNYARLLALKSEKKEILPLLKSAGIVSCYKDITDNTKWIWEEENVYADTHSLLLDKKINNRNTLFI